MGILTDRGGASEFVRDGIDGILVDPQDSAALRAALSRIASDEGLRSALSAAGRDRVPEFTWARVAKAYEDLYAAAGPGRGGGIG